jgi:hypothetical protein
MAEIADITPSNAEATDRLLVRRSGAAPYGLDLLANLTPSELLALRDEIIAARGDRSLLGERIGAISSFASPNAGGIVVGNYYDNAFHTSSTTTLASAANRVQMAPFYTSERLRISEIGVAVSTISAGALGKCFIYGSGPDNWPSDLLFEAPNDLDFGVSNYQAHSIDFTFDVGRVYWLGVRSSGTGTLRSIPSSSLVNFGVISNASAQYKSVIRRVISYSDALPDPWVFDSEDAISATMPSIRMKAAAL